MSFMNDYINRKMAISEYESELLKLISEYNKLRGEYLFVYAAAIGKPIQGIALEQSDFYMIRDLLANQKDSKKLAVYIETPGGSGETAEEVVRFLHNNFDTVSFIISGEAKSAGTIIVLSGDEILMTETGSLGPIDAQMKIGRSIVSAYDYIEWVKEKQKEAEEQGRLNPFDASIVAQITPGELSGVLHALEFAKELVIEWLVKYKFKNWTVTETRKLPVSESIKENRAKEIADELINHSKWRLHGRSIKIDDLDKIGLRVTRVDDDPILSEIIYRIQTVCRLLFENTTAFKIFATQDNKIFRHAVQAGSPIRIPQINVPDVVQLEQKCPKCDITHKIYAKFALNPQFDLDLTGKGFKPFPENSKIICDCGFEIDLLGIKNQIEIKTGRKIVD